METLRQIVVVIFVVSMLYAGGWELFRGVFVKKRFKEYENGLKTKVTDSDELMNLLRNMNCFLIRQLYYNEQGNVEVQAKYGKHVLRFEDGVIHVIRDMDDSRRNYDYIVEENAILDSIAKEEDHGLPINPFTKYKNAIRLTKLHTVSLIGAFGGMALTLALYLMPSGSKYIQMVKEGTPESYPQITYGEAFGDYFADQDWKYFKSTKGEKIVEFNGKCGNGSEETDLCIQFVISDDNETFQTDYLDIDGEPQNALTMGSVLHAIFGSYEDSHGINATDTANKNEVGDNLENYDLTGQEDAGLAEETEQETSSPNEYNGVDVEHLNYRELYSGFITEMDSMYDGYCSYSLYDLNGDGRKELLLGYGTCDADYQNIIYMVDENGAVSSTATFYGSFVYYEAEDGAGLYAVSGQMGVESVERITLQGNEVVEEPLWTMEIGDGEYYSNDHPVIYVMGSDLSLLDE